MAKQLTGVRVAILAMDGVEQPELTEPRTALEAAGAQTTLNSAEPGEIQGFNHHDKGDTFHVEATFNQVTADEFDALLLPGGALNADALRTLPEAKRFVQEFESDGKPIACICHASWLLASAGLVGGRTMTSYHAIKDDLRNAEADWVDEEVVTDSNWVTSRKPDDIPAFNREMISVFAELRQHAYA